MRAYTRMVCMGRKARMPRSKMVRETTSVSPRARRRTRARRAFLNVARRMVVEHGPAGLSLREVARQTDYSPAALYEYFASRDALLAALIQEGFDELKQAFAAVSADLPPREQLASLGLTYIDFARRQPETFELLFTYHTTKRKQLEEVQQGDNHYAIFRAAVAAIIPDASSHKIDRDTYGFWALVHGLAMLQTTFLQHFETDFGRADRSIITHFIDGFVNCSV
jgi:AcrR family transcriptional regulator